ncbi:MAG: LysR family transcriptional regulator, partial [Clostridia bacterium]|nr:LysR family transcriptional regulator [Clostridia bacterium]
MKIQEIKILLAICDKGSMTKAADALNISQPTVSRTIKKVSKQYNIKIFENIGHRLRLSTEGE